MNKTFPAALLLLFAVFASAPAALAQLDNEVECNNNENTSVAPTTPKRRFVIGANNNDNLIFDRKTGLMWQRCPTGYLFDSPFGVCAEDPNATDGFTWQQALDRAQTANGNNLSGYSDWRVPNVKQLASIVENRCYGPAANDLVFSTAPAGAFWTNSPTAQSNDPNTISGTTVVANKIWAVNFSQGQVLSAGKTDVLFLRLVRVVDPGNYAALNAQ